MEWVRFFRERGGVCSQDQLRSGRGELCEASDREIFVIQRGIVAQDVVGLEEVVSRILVYYIV